MARLYELDARILLLGIGHASNTSLHLAKYRASGARQILQGAPLMAQGQRVWRQYQDIELHEELFAELGADLESAHSISPGRAGQAEARLLSMHTCVDFAVTWIERHRGSD